MLLPIGRVLDELIEELMAETVTGIGMVLMGRTKEWTNKAGRAVVDVFVWCAADGDQPREVQVPDELVVQATSLAGGRCYFEYSIFSGKWPSGDIRVDRKLRAIEVTEPSTPNGSAAKSAA